MREGRLGGAFFTVWAPCPELVGEDSGKDFLDPTNGLRDSIEILDIINNMNDRHPEHFQVARNSSDIRAAFKNNKIASLIGMEGTHFLGNSLSTVRMFAAMGVKYLTLTHTCHSSFASSNGAGQKMTQYHEGNGLSEFGRELVLELNRLGVMVDLAHTSDQTMKDAISISKAPVVWTHTGARAVWDHPRNVPDDILQLIGDGSNKHDGILLSVFYPPFIGPPETANVSHVADHIEHIANIVGKNHVGIASDFDGMYSSVKGLEDASKYPNLVVELLDRAWTDDQIRGVLGENLMRVIDEVDKARDSLQAELPSSAIWEKRSDAPKAWGGPGNAYLPLDIQEIVRSWPSHDEL